MDMEKSRVILGHDGRMHDEILEVIYEQVYHQTLDKESSEMVPMYLDQYTAHREDRILFDNALTDFAAALTWTSQFGTTRIWPIEQDDIAQDYPALAEHGDRWVAKVGSKRVGYRVYARTRVEAIVLAGVQVLRDHANELLNATVTSATIN